MILHGEYRLAPQRNSTVRAIKQRDVCLIHALRQAVAIQRKPVVHRGNLDFLSRMVLNRVVRTVVTKLHLLSLSATGKSK